MMYLPHPVSKYLEGGLRGRALRRFEHHLTGCEKCRSHVEADRRIQQRLRESAGPEPRGDLADRILARNAGVDPPAGQPVQPCRQGRPALVSDGQNGWVDSGVPGRRKLIAAFGSAALVVVATLTGAYAVGGSGTEQGVAESVFASAQPVGGADQQMSQKAAMAPSDLDRLRTAGWNCPELSGLGYHLERARGYRIADHPTVELVLTKGDSTITVYERRKGHAPDVETHPARAAPVINAATGNTTAADGFSPVPLQMGGGDVTYMWFRYGERWQIAFQSQEAWYTVESDLPVTKVAAAVAQVAATDRAQLARPAQAEPAGVFDRIWNGLTGNGR